MESGFITIGGSKLYLEKEGVGDPIIFIHADALDSRQWDPQFEYFSKKFTVIRYDVRGFGKSEILTDVPYSFSEDLYSLMGFLTIQKAHFVGLSLGAAIIIDLSLTHPEKVNSMVLADPGISGDGFNQIFIDNINAITDFAKSGNLDQAKNIWLDLPIFDDSRKLPNVWEQVRRMVRDSSGYRWYGKNQPTDIDPPGVQKLSEINVPTLILVGEHDIDDFQRKARLLHEKIINSKFVTIPNAGHLSNMDNPEEFNKAVDSFLF